MDRQQVISWKLITNKTFQNSSEIKLSTGQLVGSEALGDWVLIGLLEDDFMVYDINGMLDTLKVADRKQFISLDSAGVNSSTMSLNNKFFGENSIEWTDDCKILLESIDGGKFNISVGIKDGFLYLYFVGEKENFSFSIITHTQRVILKYAKRNSFTEDL